MSLVPPDGLNDLTLTARDVPSRPRREVYPQGPCAPILVLDTDCAYSYHHRSHRFVAFCSTTTPPPSDVRELWRPEIAFANLWSFVVENVVQIHPGFPGYMAR